MPEPSEAEIAFLLDVLGRVLEIPARRGDVLGAFAGLRPLLAGPHGSSADLSRRHAILTSPDGVITVVGGKLTTYRQMAQDAVDTALRSPPLGASGRPARPCRTRQLPLAGAASQHALARVAAPWRLVARYGTEAPAIAALGKKNPALSNRVADGIPVTGAQIAFALLNEGAMSEDDVLDRRTRIGLVPADRQRALPAVRRLLGHLPAPAQPEQARGAAANPRLTPGTAADRCHARGRQPGACPAAPTLARAPPTPPPAWSLQPARRRSVVCCRRPACDWPRWSSIHW